LSWEAEVIRALQSLASPLLDAFFLVLTQCGGDLFWLLAIFALFALRRKREAVGLSALLLTSFYGTYSLKHAIGRPRPGPELRRPVVEPSETPSMPSTHASEAAGNFGYLAHKAKRRWATGACATLTVLAGLSRVYLGVHWPTDVLAGFGFGLLILAIWVKLVEPRLWPWLAHLAERTRKAYVVPIPLAAGILIAIFTPPWFGGPPPAYVGGLVAGIFLGAMMAEGAQRPFRSQASACVVLACLITSLVGLAASVIIELPAAQFLASFLTGIWGSWLGPKAFWALRVRMVVSGGQSGLTAPSQGP